MSHYEQLYRKGYVRTANIVEPDDFIVDFISTLQDKQSSTIIDVGCGAGRNAVFLAKQGFYVVGVDISSTAVELALQKAKKQNVKNCVFVEHDFLFLPFPNGQFDAAFSSYGIENVSLSESALLIQPGETELTRLMQELLRQVTGPSRRISPDLFVEFISECAQDIEKAREKARIADFIVVLGFGGVVSWDGTTEITITTEEYNLTVITAQLTHLYLNWLCSILFLVLHQNWNHLRILLNILLLHQSLLMQIIEEKKVLKK